MLTKRHFIEFADFLVDEQIKLKAKKKKLIEEYILDINLDKDYEQLTANIMLILDRNSLRFNEYQFKNYIVSHVEKKQLNNTKNENTTNLNKVGKPMT